MKNCRKLFLALLAVAFLLPLFPRASQAAEMNSPGLSDDTSVQTTLTYINPLYADSIDESDLKKPADNDASPYAISEYCTSIEDAGSQMREQMKKRQESIEVGLQTSSDEELSTIATAIFQESIIHTGKPTEGDYLRWQYGGWNCSISQSTQNGIRSITFTYTMTYYTTAEQEAEVDTAVKNLLDQLNLDKKNDYEKISSIYEYICTNVTYDHENLNDDDYKLKFTAYAALINKTAVCQGYATLLYRLSLETGIDARLIAGKGNGENHGWNIARLGNYYYNLDSTWDAGKTEYDYFLLCNDNFSKHERFDEYQTDEFNRSYPMSEKDYDPSKEEPDPEPDPENPFVDVNEDDYYYDAVIWAYTNGITSGKDDTHFEPSSPCTRAQSVTFLWRAYGQPEPATTENPFVDVDSSDYYYKSVLWAYENGVTSGIDDIHFGPSHTVTRKEFVTFLWRSEGEPQPKTTENPFVDVPDGTYYTKAVLWAYENGITSGKDDTHFQPDAECVRAQVVSFLYRFFN
ncbi:MAG: S-layer homology domain-containing protein [Eubacterium sp.]|nr:S-layer homology domain-containing protein [Eubacterium sp.]